MSTIASPREPSTPLRRHPSSPAPSSRASLDSTFPLHSPNPTAQGLPLSATASPSPSAGGGGGGGSSTSSSNPKRANRAALREYYNLKRAAAAAAGVTDQQQSAAIQPFSGSEVPHSELDAPNFDADAFVRRSFGESGLEELLRLYTRVLGEIRALDAEKKGLVYDNYSKLITATDTIKKMRANMDPLNPMASMLDPKIGQIYAQASSIRDALREEVPRPDEAEARKRRARELAAEVVAMPQKLRELVNDGRVDEARAAWVMPRRLLLSWKEKGQGGTDVEKCLAAGDSVFDESESSGTESELEDT